MEAPKKMVGADNDTSGTARANFAMTACAFGTGVSRIISPMSLFGMCPLSPFLLVDTKSTLPAMGKKAQM